MTVPPALPELRYNLALVGGRGSGKSSITRRILRREKRFMLFSLDDLIRYEEGGRTIPQIVDARGWMYFRDVEHEVTHKVGAFEGRALIDCGGGVVVDLDAEGNEVFSERKVNALKRRGLIVYLQRDPEYLTQRIAGDANRPSLSETQSFAEIMARRDPWYRRAADYVFPCGELGKTEIVDGVLDWYYAQL